MFQEEGKMEKKRIVEWTRFKTAKKILLSVSKSKFQFDLIGEIRGNVS